jgi:hypothetical protein
MCIWMRIQNVSCFADVRHQFQMDETLDSISDETPTVTENQQ